MKFSPHAIEELRELYLQRFGKTLSDAEVVELGTRLVSLLEIIFIKKDEESV